MSQTRKLKLLAAILALALSLGVFALYTRASFLVMLGDQLWSCF